MKSVFLASVAVLVSAFPAFSGDTAVKAPPYPAPSWTGFYFGANLGYGWGNPGTINPNGVGSSVPTGSLTFPDTLTEIAADLAGLGPVSTNPQGPLGGVQVGYNHQFSSLVLGVEADFSAASIEQSVTRTITAAGSSVLSTTTVLRAQESLRSFGTLRGRIGFTPFPSLLLYGTGGLAYGQASVSLDIAQTGSCSPCTSASVVDAFTPSFNSASTTLVGWTAGAGAEWAVAPHWSIKGEYLYYDLGTLSFSGATITGTSPANGNIPFFVVNMSPSAEFKGSLARIGFNYKFF